MRRAVGRSPPRTSPQIAGETAKTAQLHISVHQEVEQAPCAGQDLDSRQPSPPPPAAQPQAPPQLQHLSPLWLSVWLLVAAAVPVMVALLGVCARYLQASC